MLAAVHGVFAEEFRHFERHELEDNIVYVGLRRGRVGRELIAPARRAADVPAAKEELLAAPGPDDISEAPTTWSAWPESSRCLRAARLRA